MTKAEEMQRYDEFVRKLPQDSYLRPWLAGIRDHVETDLRNDIIPEHSPREIYRECQQIRNEAAASIRKDLDRKRADAHRIIAHCDDEEQLDDASDHANYTETLGGVIAQRIVLVAHLRAIGRL